MRVLKNEIEMRKKENNKTVKHGMSESQILINGLTRKLSEERAKLKNAKTSISTKYKVRNKQIRSTSKNSR